MDNSQQAFESGPLIKVNEHYKHHLGVSTGESVMRKHKFRTWDFSRAESLETWEKNRNLLSETDACTQGSGTLEFEQYQMQLDIMIHLCIVCMFFVRAKLSCRV